MTLFGVDISYFQPDFDFYRARQEGYSFAIIRACDGATFADPRYQRHVQMARLAGVNLLSAYIYCRNPSEGRGTIEQQVNLAIRTMGDNPLPIWLDCETDAGLAEYHIQEFYDRFMAAGIRVCGVYTYVPWWQRMGNINTTQWGFLWVAGYGANRINYGSADYESKGGDHAPMWRTNLGGLTPHIWQFSSNGVVAGRRGNTDVNAFRGDEKLLYQIFYGKEPKMSEINREVASAVDENVKFADFIELNRIIDKNVWENNVMLRNLCIEQGLDPEALFLEAKGA